jgi:rhodanese-related sulfurtransferase
MPMPRDVDHEELQRLLGEGAQLVEVLPAEEYEDEHLPGAIHLPLRKIETDADAMLDRNRPIVVYCWDSA